jgi:putative transcriptional regulator
MMEQSLAGQLLLAAPSLRDPNFARTVVLVGVHGEEGAMGVVLNRPASVSVADAVPQLQSVVGEDEPIFVGGPVQPQSVVVIAEFLEKSDAGLLLVGSVGFPAADADLGELALGAARARVFAGYAGWSRSQLDAEVESGDWITHEAQPSDVFTEAPDELWSSVLTRMGGSYALIARMPLDPSVN